MHTPAPGSAPTAVEASLATRTTTLETATIASPPTTDTPTPTPITPPTPSPTPYPTPDKVTLQVVGQVGGQSLTVAVEGSTTYLGVGPRLMVLDVSAPDAPQLLGQSAVLPGVVQDIVVVGGRGECLYSIGVFDLEMQIARLLHPYTPVGIGGQPPAPAWSPDGRWLAFTAWATNPNDAGLWVVRADGQQEEHHLDAGSRADHNPIWSPDGRWLAFSSTPQGVGSGLWLAEVETWNLHSPDLLPDAYPVDWISPRP